MEGTDNKADVLSASSPDNKCQFTPDDFKNNVAIGRGKDSVIYRATCAKLGGNEVAVKVYNKDKVSASKLRAIKREAAMMIYMTRKRVPLITQFHGALQDSKHIYIVMEYCKGGDLLEKLLKEGRAMTERRVCQEVAAPLLATLKHMHSLAIIHRDIKLENIFLAEDGSVKLGDFGLTMSKKQELAISPVGTVEYMAPEVVALPPVDQVTSGAVLASSIKPCDEKVDIWALGVTLYELLTGHLPFEGRDKPEIKKAIAEGQLKPLPATMSAHCKDFITSMLRQNASDRPSAEELLQHAFIQQHVQAVKSRGMSDSVTSLDAMWRVAKESSTGSVAGSLPGSFTTRHDVKHNPMASMPEVATMKAIGSGLGAADSQDRDYIKARHLLGTPDGSSPGSSPGSAMGSPRDSMTAARSPLAPKSRPVGRGDRRRWSNDMPMEKSHLSVTTDSSTPRLDAAQLSASSSAGLLHKVAGLLKQVFSQNALQHEPSGAPYLDTTTPV